jgi:hypothetical protein
MPVEREAGVDGKWSYGGAEIPGEFGWSRIDERFRRTTDIGDEADVPLCAWRLEFKVLRDDLGEHLRHAMVAEHPYAAGWTHGLSKDKRVSHDQRAPTLVFKGVNHQAAVATPDVADRKFSTLDEALQWLESHPYDYWETRSQRMTAAIPQPDLAYQPNSRSKRSWTDRAMMLGVCANLPRAYKEVMESSKGRDLIDATNRGSLIIHKPNVGDIPVRELARGSIRDELHDRYDLLHLAVMQTLAGPHDDVVRWFGRPLVDKLNHIYTGLIAGVVDQK